MIKNVVMWYGSGQTRCDRTRQQQESMIRQTTPRDTSISGNLYLLKWWSKKVFLTKKRTNESGWMNEWMDMPFNSNLYFLNTFVLQELGTEARFLRQSKNKRILKLSTIFCTRPKLNCKIKKHDGRTDRQTVHSKTHIGTSTHQVCVLVHLFLSSASHECSFRKHSDYTVILTN